MLKKIGLWIKNFFTKSFDFLEINAAKAVKIVDAVKAAVNNPLIDMVTSLTLTPVDNMAVATVRHYVAKVAEQMLIAEKIIGINKTEAQILKELTKYLADKSPDARAKFYVELAGELAVILSDGKITLSEAISLTQLVFSQQKK